jgi:hypothetical protein
MVSYGKVPYFINDKNKKQFRRPTSLTLDHSGNIFVVDEGIKVRQQCKLHNKRGGQFEESDKYSARLFSAVYVVERGNSRIQVFVP